MTHAPASRPGAAASLGAMLTAAAALPAAAQPHHFLILQSSNLAGGSEYEVEARGDIDKVDGSLAGISVSANDDDQISDGDIEGQVSKGADGYRIDGGIARIEIENPEAVQIFTGLIRGGGNADGSDGGGHCRVGIVAESVDFLHGQGEGEGPFELKLVHRSGRRTTRSDLTRLPPGNRRSLGDRVFARRMPQGEHITRQLSVEITEIEDESDYFTGEPDGASAKLGPVRLGCDVSRELHPEFVLEGAAEDEAGRVRVNYAIGRLDE